MRVCVCKALTSALREKGKKEGKKREKEEEVTCLTTFSMEITSSNVRKGERLVILPSLPGDSEGVKE